MADFDQCFFYVLRNEQDVLNAYYDGHLKRFGINLIFLLNLTPETLRKYGIFHEPNANTVKELTLDQAKLIYKHEFWNLANFKDIKNQTVCSYLFDTCVDIGIIKGIKLLQRAICAKTLTENYVKVDGILGDLTIHSLNAENLNILPVLVAEREAYYRAVIDANLSKGVHLNDCLSRCYRIYPTACL